METVDHFAAVLTRQQEFFDNATFSDVTLRFSMPFTSFGQSNLPIEIYAHRTILTIGSEWFKRALSLQGNQVMLVLPVADEGAMKRLLRHIYGFSVFPAPYPSTVFMDIKLLCLADTFQVSALVEQAEKSTAGRLRAMKDDMTWTAATCAVVLRDIYAAPKGDGTLRRLAAEVCHNKMGALVADDMFQRTLLKYPEIAADIMKRPSVTVKTEAQESNKRRRV